MKSAFTSLKRIDYLGSLLLLISTIILIIENQDNLIVILPLLIICLVAVVIIVMDYLYYQNPWMLYICVSGYAFIAGYRMDFIVAVVMLTSILFYAIKYLADVLLYLVMLAIIGGLIGFGIGFIVNIQDLEATSVVVQSLFVVTLAIFMLFEVIQSQNESIRLSNDLQFSETRFLTIVESMNSLSRFIPISLRHSIITERKSAILSSKRTKMTVFFSDIVGFTDLSDNISPDELNEVLNLYMDRMTLVAKRHGAVLDKFIGDGMMCFFGSSSHSSVQKDAINCVLMALDMRREMKDLRRVWRSRGHDLHLRMGVNTGYCHVGNFGSDNRMSYTALGKEVNLAARLEGVAQTGEIIISQSTYDYINYYFHCEIVGSVQLKGFEKPVTCYRVLEQASSLKNSQWLDHELPGFNLHLNFNDIKDYDYNEVRTHLIQAIARVNKEEQEAQKPKGLHINRY